jgi:hypothetical protein
MSDNAWFHQLSDTTTSRGPENPMIENYVGRRPGTGPTGDQRPEILRPLEPQDRLQLERATHSKG